MNKKTATFKRPVRVTFGKTKTKWFSQHCAMADCNRPKQIVFGNSFTTRKGKLQL